MHFIAKLILSAIVNLAGLLIAATWIDGFALAGAPADIAVVAIVLTILNLFLKPILKLIFGPIILLTLGLGALVVNAVILKLLDFFSPALSIQTIPALLLATILLSAVNIILNSATKHD
jgi:putative membrane protein